MSYYSKSPKIIREFALSHGWHHDEHQDGAGLADSWCYDCYTYGDNRLEVEFDPHGRVWQVWINSHWYRLNCKMVLDALHRIARTPSLEVDHHIPPGRQETE